MSEENQKNKETIATATTQSPVKGPDKTQGQPLPKPKLGKKPSLILAWLVPLLAIGLTGFFVYHSLPEKGLDIRILAKNGAAIDPQRTLLKYRGVRVGIVSQVGLNDSAEQVVIEATLDNDYRDFAKEKSQFWVVRPEISLAGVQGLDTIVSGPYINLRPGNGKQKLEFEALSSPAVSDNLGEGLRLQIKSPRLGAMKIGTQIMYREVTIGEVYNFKLSETAQFVRLLVFIEEPYKNLIRKNSVFWNAGGFDLNVSLFGAKITTESIKGILTGGIGVATPEDPAEVVQDGAVFELREKQQGEWLEWAPSIDVMGGKNEGRSHEAPKKKKTLEEHKGAFFSNPHA
ncbi:MlaD family protein [Geopsychrobacter electrodiphilus]|uniref:MlaD family protein n=1 Tax=Geopsychrobacter electrodiphilus TaxID=225196 RepID=UPI00038051E1|nr:MlaD family protein [Geopsychrobacter electrodiphilus]